MTQDEILSAAREAGCNDEFIKMAPCWLENYAVIIERKTIERCAERSEQYHNHSIGWKLLDVSYCAAAIRKLGEDQ